jgi:outer membrane receptor protein involved in Fe transport
MKNILIATVATVMLLSANAQMPSVQSGARTQQMPALNNGRIYGRIVDADKKPIADISVILLQTQVDPKTKKKKEVLFKAMVTHAKGEFSFEDVPVMGALVLKVSGTGYIATTTNVSFKMPAPAGVASGNVMPGNPMAAMPSFDKDLGDLLLQQDIKQLSTVTVVARQPQLRMDADKKIFSVEKSLMSAGGTALDIMKNVPSVNVDLDGNVTMRNAAPQILVDGRPTTLSLDQIPADAIESVEVITNPSAKYDASGGGAGILNVVLKKNRKTGYNGNLRVGVDKRGALNGGGDINARFNRINISASLMGHQNKGITQGTTERNNFSAIVPSTIYQSNYNQTKGGFIFAKAGLDFFASNRATISLNAFRVHGEFKPYETIDIATDSLFSGGKSTSYSERIANSQRVFNGKGLSLGFKQLFKKDGEELTADANYFEGKNESNALYTTNLLNSNGGIMSTDLLRTTGNGSDKNLILQTDYVRPVGNGAKLELGLRGAFRSRINNLANAIFDNTTNTYTTVAAATSNYKNTDQVLAAYATYSGAIKSFSYKLGLRAESSAYSGELTNTGEKFSNDYPVSLFPSVFLTQKLANKQQVQFSYSRRINRPNFFQLIPFTDYSDKLNITRGNPGLVPEFTQSFELSYLKTFKGNNTLLFSGYYKQTNHLITRYLEQQVDPVTGSTALINTYINANSSYTTGMEVTSQVFMNKWWDLSANLNVYQSKINTGTTTNQDAMWSWFSKFNNNVKLPAGFSLQLTAVYQSKTNLPVSSNQNMGGPPMMQSQSASQGYIKANWGMDVAVKKTFLKDNSASITLSASDIFRTRWSSQYSYSDYFTQTYDRLRDPQMFRLNFAYRFGKLDMNLFKRKNTKTDQGSGESMQQ